MWCVHSTPDFVVAVIHNCASVAHAQRGTCFMVVWLCV